MAHDSPNKPAEQESQQAPRGAFLLMLLFLLLLTAAWLNIYLRVWWQD